MGWDYKEKDNTVLLDRMDLTSRRNVKCRLIRLECRMVDILERAGKRGSIRFIPGLEEPCRVEITHCNPLH